MADTHPSQAGQEEVAGKLHDLLSTLWERSRQTIAERLETLRTSVRALRVNPGDAEARKAGGDAAHKLAGILGTFGLPEGTELARHAEGVLESGLPIAAVEVEAMAQAVERMHQMIEAKSKDAGKRRS